MIEHLTIMLFDSMHDCLWVQNALLKAPWVLEGCCWVHLDRHYAVACPLGFRNGLLCDKPASHIHFLPQFTISFLWQ
jgi:hypothetical protein